MGCFPFLLQGFLTQEWKCRVIKKALNRLLSTPWFLPASSPSILLHPPRLFFLLYVPHLPRSLFSALFSENQMWGYLLCSHTGGVLTFWNDLKSILESSVLKETHNSPMECSYKLQKGSYWYYPRVIYQGLSPAFLKVDQWKDKTLLSQNGTG